MNNGSILVWDTELHIDKFLFQEDRGEIISLSIDENYLISGSLDGQAHIYELINGNQIYKCYHNTHFNYPIQLVSNNIYIHIYLSYLDFTILPFYVTCN